MSFMRLPAAVLSAAVLASTALAGEADRAPPPAAPVSDPPWMTTLWHRLPEAERLRPPPSSGPVRIARWRDDRPVAFSFIFDDGQPDQAAIALPALEAIGVRGTVALIASWPPEDEAAGAAVLARRRAQLQEQLAVARVKAPHTIAGIERRLADAVAPVPWPVWKAAAERGHEIANHGLHHRGLKAWTSIDADGLREEVLSAKALIEQRIGQPVVSFIGPYNDLGTPDAGQRLVDRTHIIVRVGSGVTYDGQGATDAAATIARLDAQFDRAIAAPGPWHLSMVHGLVRDYAKLGEGVFEGHIRHVGAQVQAGAVWVAPAGTVGRYHHERMHAVLTAVSSANACDIRLECPLPAALFNEPLTLVVATGATPSAATARRDGRDLPVRIRGGDLLIDAAPGPAPIAVTWMP
jgi:peptidoglycan/xylan/chitin deacetylase (PgdA/CDA1 family)